MVSIRDLLIGKKAVITVDLISEQTRMGIVKSYVPKFLYKPPYGYPRYVDINYVRWLAQTPYVEMCISTILDNIASIDWDVGVTEKTKEKYTDDNGDINEVKKAEIEHVTKFLNNPNTNKESFEYVFIRQTLRDVLEIEAGVLNKVFNLKEEMVEVIARDGGTFTKNPDIHGMYTDRDDIIFNTNIVADERGVNTMFSHVRDITSLDAKERAAYFQYGWMTGPAPIPYGKSEIMWLERMPRTDQFYGFSPVQILAKSLQMLMYMIDSDLEYYNDNNVPKGIIGLDGSDADEISAFKQMWTQNMRVPDEMGNLKKMMNKVPIVNKTPAFTRIEFSATEMQVIEKQKWYTKMVWACFGVTPTELGYTEDAKGSANQIVQSKVFRKKAINPLLRLVENAINKEIILQEFEYEDIEFKFNMFDIDDERNKYELFELQTKSGIRTINEVRMQEGLDSVDWGDDAPREWQQSENSNFFGGGFDERSQDANDTDLPDKEPKVGQKSLSPDARRAAESAQEDDEEEDSEEEKPKKKAQSNESPLILKEGEIPGEEQFIEAVDFVLNKIEDDLITAIEKEMGKSVLSEVKSVNDIINSLKNLISFELLKGVTYASIKASFMSGWDQAERHLDKNFVPDQAAISYIQNYTFENIKGMSESLATQLRGELKRSFMQGMGIGEIKKGIEKVFNVSENRAEAIARTETARAQNYGRWIAYKKSGEPGKKRWMSAIDSRTSDICRRLDGQVVDVNDNFKDKKTGWEGPAPPSHVNCRSSWVFMPE